MDFLVGYIELILYYLDLHKYKIIALVFAYFYFRYTNIRSDYGARIITGTMGASKSFDEYKRLKYISERKYRDPNMKPLIISNTPYPFVDVLFSSHKDLNVILKHLVYYMTMTNDVPNDMQFLKNNFNKFRPIELLIDEAHLYFASSDFNKIFASDKNLLTVDTQLRKRYITMKGVTQEYSQLVSQFRRLVPFITSRLNFLGFIKMQKKYRVKKDDTDLKDPSIAEYQFFASFPFFFLHPSLQFWADMKKYMYLSHYVINLEMNLLDNYTFDDFLKNFPNVKYNKDTYIITPIDSPLLPIESA